MAWSSYWPMARGHSLRASALNEIRTACIERGITSPGAELVRGQSLSDVRSLLVSAQVNIRASSNWIHVGSGPSYVFEVLSTGDIFTKAGVSDWGASGSFPKKITAAAINDIYKVLNVLRCKRLTPSLSASPHDGRSSDLELSCGAAMTAMEAEELAVGEGGAESSWWTYNTVTRNYGSNQYLAWQNRYARIYSITLPGGTTAAYTYVKVRARAALVASSGDPGQADPVRQPLLNVRAGSATAPTTYSGSLSYGTALLSDEPITGTGFNTGTYMTKVLRAGGSDNKFILLSDQNDPTDAGVCDWNPWGSEPTYKGEVVQEIIDDAAYELSLVKVT